MKIGFYINATKDGAPAVAEALARRAVALGLDTLPPDAGATAAPDIWLALGGDGTILRCVREHPDAAVLGFNLGGLGYLSAVEQKDFESALMLLAAGRFRVAERTMLALAIRGRNQPGGASPASEPIATALNDIVITREMTGHAALLDLSVGGHRPTRYLADGLVIATPTGSTAYSLSAGGPVVMSDSRSLVITPMNPHALGIRPMVVADSARLAVTAISRGASAGESAAGAANPPRSEASALGVYADGAPMAMLKSGETVEIFKAQRVARLIELEGFDPYAVLANKLGWTGTTL